VVWTPNLIPGTLTPMNLSRWKEQIMKPNDCHAEEILMVLDFTAALFEEY
jgi:hypothetical protein